ncbi:sperm-associated antigen 1 [Ambystoma mexicanum]|uniref:sperm-associated antigen 1 n=1 Tax=Ambystoma mexicanum TaxID=8296 RepID=UPI0037E959A0
MSSLMNYGTTKTFQIPIDHLDYKFIETCTDVKHLEKILIILRSGEEGCYPDLTEFCEKRLESLDPKSRALRKDKPAATAASFPSEEWQAIEDDVEGWVTDIKVKEKTICFPKTENTFQEKLANLPPVRSSKSCPSITQNKSSENTLGKKKRMPRDYRDWDKFDVEKECSKIDEHCDEKSAKGIINSKMPKIEKRLDTAGSSEIEKHYIANHEKEKGNEAFRSGDFCEAVTYYTRSISAQPSIAAFNNRAQAEIKRQNWRNALNDCEKVLDLEPGNLKALLRRATVNSQLNNNHRAVEDLHRVLRDEPDNAIAQKLLSEVEEKLKTSENIIPKKAKRILIQEVEGSDEGEAEDEKNDEADKGDGVPVGGETAEEEERSAMGNAQKKFPGREEEPTAWKKRDDGDSGPRKDVPGRGNKGGSPKEADNARNACQRRPEQSPAAPGAGAAPPAVNGPTSLLPPTAATLKDQGNELFKHGQFGAAVAKYSEAIESLRNPGTAIPEELSILYSNRAACYLKDGNCGDCIEDCTRALELQPFSIKPLLRRALAYESVEKYRQAYVDYKTVLQIDSGIQSANDSINRITRTLMDQDGLNWREKLPPIPAVPVSAQSHRWAGSCTPSKAKAQVTNSKTSEEMFLSLKQEGNALVKKAQFRQALEKYNACVKLNSNECSIYTNRALCYLKLDQFDEARQDCDRALQLDDANVKAFYRRAIAHKGLKNYQASINDLNKVLQMDQNVSEARKELEEVTQSLKARKNSIANSQEKQRKKIDIQEINEKKEDGRKSKDLISSVATERVENRPEETSKKITIFKPTNAYDFGQLMNAVRAEKDSAACAELLTTVEPKDLPSFLSNKLEVDTFLIIIQSLKSYLLEEQPTLVYQHLLYLSKADRFEINLKLLSQSEKNQVRQLFDALLQKQHQKLIFEDVPSLSRNYYL